MTALRFRKALHEDVFEGRALERCPYYGSERSAVVLQYVNHLGEWVDVPFDEEAKR